MTVFLEKPLTPKQRWVLEYLATYAPTCAHDYYDDGFHFVTAYAEAFKILYRNGKRVRRSLQYVLHGLRGIGLVSSNDATNWQGGGDCGPSHCNTYDITNRGRRVAYEHNQALILAEIEVK